MSLYKMDGPAFTQFSARQRQTASSTQIPPLLATFFFTSNLSSNTVNFSDY
jgi:hypothetical protein